MRQVLSESLKCIYEIHGFFFLIFPRQPLISLHVTININW